MKDEELGASNTSIMRKRINIMGAELLLHKYIIKPSYTLKLFFYCIITFIIKHSLHYRAGVKHMP